MRDFRSISTSGLCTNSNPILYPVSGRAVCEETPAEVTFVRELQGEGQRKQLGKINMTSGYLIVFGGVGGSSNKLD